VTLPAKQQGMTLLGFVFVLAFLLSIAYLGIKIAPIYMSYFSVVDAMKKVALEPGAGALPSSQLQDRLNKVLYVNYVEGLKPENLKVVRTRTGKEIQLNYDVNEHIVGNLSVCIHFEKIVPIR